MNSENHTSPRTVGDLSVVGGSASVAITLRLVLTHHWYDLTERGEKLIEYRAITPFWNRMIWKRRMSITRVCFQRAYTQTRTTRRVDFIDIGPCPIPGWAGEYYRIHFLPNAKIRDGEDGSK